MEPPSEAEEVDALLQMSADAVGGGLYHHRLSCRVDARMPLKPATEPGSCSAKLRVVRNR